MSNARSPREVCSTTIGTSGLTVLASFCVSASNPALERPVAALGASLARSGCGGVGFGLVRIDGVGALGVELAALLGLLDRDRLRGIGHQIEGLALRQVVLELLEAARVPQPLVELLGRRALGGSGALDRLHDLLLGGLDALGLDDRGEDGLAAQRLLVVPRALLDDVRLLAAGDAQVCGAVDALVREGVDHLLPQLTRAGLD